MNPDDTRHGTNVGYNRGCREVCCRTAQAAWMRAYRSRRAIYGPDTVDGLGTRRRIRALMALGWSTTSLDQQLGKRRTYTAKLVAGDHPIHRSTAEAYRELYERLSMTLPSIRSRYDAQRISRVRGHARAKGWPPPLAWDDIDTDPEPNLGGDDDQIDQVVVHRILNGDWRLPCTPAEKAEVCRRWFAQAHLQYERGTGYEELERRTGWKVDRYYTAGRRAA